MLIRPDTLLHLYCIFILNVCGMYCMYFFCRICVISEHFQILFCEIIKCYDKTNFLLHMNLAKEYLSLRLSKPLFSFCTPPEYRIQLEKKTQALDFSDFMVRRTAWMLGRTPPWAMMTPESSLFNSSSFLMASWRRSYMPRQPSLLCPFLKVYSTIIYNFFV